MDTIWLISCHGCVNMVYIRVGTDFCVCNYKKVFFGLLFTNIFVLNLLIKLFLIDNTLRRFKRSVVFIQRLIL